MRRLPDAETVGEKAACCLSARIGDKARTRATSHHASCTAIAGNRMTEMTKSHQFCQVESAMLTSIRSIEIFVRAVDSGSFVAAARSLLIDPAAVSRTIKGLEEN